MARTLIVDTEFTGFTKDSKILSLALVDIETGGHFYVEIRDTLEDVLEEDVRSRLTCAQIDTFMEKAGLMDCRVAEDVLRQLSPAEHGMSLEEAAMKTRLFIEHYGEPVVLASDAIEWDHQMLIQLLDETGNWPSCTSKLMSQMKDISIESDALVFGGMDDFPHHALKDAQILADACRDLAAARSN